MKINRFFTLIMSIVISISIFTIPALATENTDEPHTEVVFLDDNLSDEQKEIATQFLLDNDTEDSAEGSVSTYNVFCNAFGHKYETSTVSVITHKARSTAPRCLQKIYLYQTCTRCNLESATVKSKSYIYCCS